MSRSGKRLQNTLLAAHAALAAVLSIYYLLMQFVGFSGFAFKLGQE